VRGEVIDRSVLIAIAIVLGTWLVIAVYVTHHMRTSACWGRRRGGLRGGGSETIRRLLGERGAGHLAVLVAVSTFAPRTAPSSPARA